MNNVSKNDDFKVDMNSEPIVKFENVSKTYTLYKNDQERFKALFFKPKKPTTHKALNRVSLEIRRGEAVGIMGDNGCGKSTMLKTITGVTFPDKGKVTVNGMVAALLELTAGFALDMTGRENIYLKGYILGMDDEEIKKLEADIIEFAELGPYIDQPVRTYSSGMKMRLGFAINVNIDPDILVVDEALSVGDASFKIKCKNKIHEIINRHVTVLYVSHNPASVKEICTRAIYMKKGRLIFDGPTEETHLIYLLDKRRTLYRNYKKQVADLETIIEGVNEKASVIPEKEKLEAITTKMAALEKEIAKIKADLKAFRMNYYGDSYKEVMKERRRKKKEAKEEAEQLKANNEKKRAEKEAKKNAKLHNRFKRWMKRKITARK